MTKNHVDRASYHGGDLDGKNVMIMFNNNEKMFNEIKTVLKNVAPNDRCSDEEIDDMNKRHIEITTLFDYLFSIARTPSGEATDEVINTAKRIIDVLRVKWDDLRLTKRMPKVHNLFTHLIPQMTMWKGIGDFLEDFVEQGHQTGVKEEYRTHGMRDRSKASQTHSKWEWSGTVNSGVQEAKTKIEKITRRKRKRDGATIKEENDKTRQENRNKKRILCLNNASIIPNVINEYGYGDDANEDEDEIQVLE